MDMTLLYRIHELVMNHPRLRRTYPKLTLQRQGTEPCSQLNDHIDRLKSDGERQLLHRRSIGARWLQKRTMPLALSGGIRSCVGIAFAECHELPHSVNLHNLESETPPAIEPFQALTRTVTLCRNAP
jgi:hypothetical protein